MLRAVLLYFNDYYYYYYYYPAFHSGLKTKKEKVNYQLTETSLP